MRNESKVAMSDIYETDFWWIQERHHRSLYVGVGHHKPLTDDDNPRAIQWFHSLENGRLSPDKKCYPLTFIHHWRNVCNDSNVYRSLTLFDNNGQPVALGPFLVDIDNFQLVKNGYKEDLEDALKVSRATVKLLRRKPYEIQANDLRVFFTGRKGFNIEVRPSSLAINMNDAADAQVRRSATKLDEIINALRGTNDIGSNATTNAVGVSGTVIDRIYGSKLNNYKLKHPYVRLHDSINQWIPQSGLRMARKKIHLSPADLCDMSAEQICQKARCDVSTPSPGEL